MIHNTFELASLVLASTPRALSTQGSSLNTPLLPDRAHVVSQPSQPEFGPPKPSEPKQELFQGVYSSSGFDMLKALSKVTTRKNPEINMGKIDLSCAFVVCDITQDDCPVVYVSEVFERLTGYTKFEIEGRNCRFLQSPEGKVEAGTRRHFVDNDSVYYLKIRIANRKEAQRSLINYRKGGQPFMNLLTIVPISGEDDGEIKYFVGFLVDVVAQPPDFRDKSTSGLYTVDYSQETVPRSVWQPPPKGVPPLLDSSPTISHNDVAIVPSDTEKHTKQVREEGEDQK
jgi:PAS domain S-box-containing protein